MFINKKKIVKNSRAAFIKWAVLIFFTSLFFFFKSDFNFFSITKTFDYASIGFLSIIYSLPILVPSYIIFSAVKRIRQENSSINSNQDNEKDKDI